jgi:hypothetical protein
MSSLGGLVWAMDQDLPPVQKLMLIKLAEAGDSCSVSSLARFCGINEAEVPTLLRLLTDRDLLTKDWRVQYVEPPSILPPAYVKRKLPRQLIEYILARDNYTCQHCGATKKLSIDHVLPESHGGGDEPDNLQVLCSPCNSRKGATYEH